MSDDIQRPRPRRSTAAATQENFVGNAAHKRRHGRQFTCWGMVQAVRSACAHEPAHTCPSTSSRGGLLRKGGQGHCEPPLCGRLWSPCCMHAAACHARHLRVLLPVFCCGLGLDVHWRRLLDRASSGGSVVPSFRFGFSDEEIYDVQVGQMHLRGVHFIWR